MLIPVKLKKLTQTERKREGMQVFLHNNKSNQCAAMLPSEELQCGQITLPPGNTNKGQRQYPELIWNHLYEIKNATHISSFSLY